MENKTMKKTRGRQKMEMKKIDDKLRLQVSFTKRKGGLFKKASELSVLCRAQIAILLQSPSGKIYAFENPSAEDLINRVSASPAPVKRRLDYGRNKYDEAMMSGGRWWEKSVEGLGLQELENHLAALEGFRENVATIINSSAAPAPALSIQDYGFGDQDLGCSASTPSYVDLDFVCGSSTTSNADQDFDFGDQDFDFGDQDLGFGDQDLGFGSSTTSFVDQDFGSFYASTTSYIC